MEIDLNMIKFLLKIQFFKYEKDDQYCNLVILILYEI